MLQRSYYMCGCIAFFGSLLFGSSCPACHCKFCLGLFPSSSLGTDIWMGDCDAGKNWGVTRPRYFPSLTASR